MAKDVDSAGPMENQAIVATGLTKWFGEGEARMTAVNGVAFAAHFGEMLFIVGPSGSGKTTLLSMISGILRPNAGTVIVKGADIWTLNNDQLADFRLNTIGFLFQDYLQTAIQICVFTAFSLVPRNALMRRCCLIHLKNSSTCQRCRYS